MTTAICYKDKNINEEFLEYVTYKTLEEAQKEADEINKTKPEKLWNGLPAKCEERIYFACEINRDKDFY